MSKILVVAAHPDDEVLGLGATIKKLSATNEIYVLIVTDGCSSQYSGQDVESLIEQKEKMAQKAAQILGVKQVLFGKLPDMKLDTVSHVDVNRVIENAVDEISPEIVFTHHYGDVNLDHQMVYRSTLVATRPSVGACVKNCIPMRCFLQLSGKAHYRTLHLFLIHTLVLTNKCSMQKKMR